MDKEILQQEIYEYVGKLDLNEEEFTIIDSYILSLLENFTKIFKLQNKVLNNEKELEKFMSLILENIEGGP
jgi:hypothetical protein